LIAPGTRAGLVGNRLVVVEPVGRRTAIPLDGTKLALLLGAGTVGDGRSG